MGKPQKRKESSKTGLTPTNKDPRTETEETTLVSSVSDSTIKILTNDDPREETIETVEI